MEAASIPARSKCARHHREPASACATVQRTAASTSTSTGVAVTSARVTSAPGEARRPLLAERSEALAEVVALQQLEDGVALAEEAGRQLAAPALVDEALDQADRARRPGRELVGELPGAREDCVVGHDLVHQPVLQRLGGRELGAGRH